MDLNLNSIGYESEGKKCIVIGHAPRIARFEARKTLAIFDVHVLGKELLIN
jgi:hypothetical protein